MDGLVWERHPAALRQPALVAAFEGWNDAADASSDAATWLVGEFGAQRFATIEPDGYFDFQSRRPEVELVDGVTRAVRWPSTECFAASVPSAERDLIIVIGVEPHYRWREFCATVLYLARETGCELLVTFGALLADVPHTRPLRLAGSANDPELVTRLGLEHSQYEGPTGIVGVLHHECREAEMPSVSLWAPVPHYVASPPDPVASRALLDRFGSLVGVPLDLHGLDHQADEWRRRVDEVVAADEQATQYVRELEARGEAMEREELEHASGDELAAELERYLREHRGEHG
ncbi:MAG TPA: PAC2 family protein [Acidimicrobiia bacterium]|jgi:predicted ATP-grasp superfamily ATP-dependent carboligase|nr:PAC2 family protein [Acidimicrobiia bacterium]